MTFWTYRDAQGVDVVVQRFEDVPAQYRAKTTTLDAAVAEKTKKAGDLVGRAIPSATNAAGFDLHLPSFLAGAGAALLVSVLVMVMLRRRGKAMALVLGALLVAAIGAGYLSFIRQQVGLGGSATPAAMIEDAKAAADAFKRQLDKQEAALKEAAK